MIAHIVVDVEASGPAPESGDMTEFGALVVQEGLLDPGFNALSFHSGIIFPECETWHDKNYAPMGMTRESHIEIATVSRYQAMRQFASWLGPLNTHRLIFWSDNPAFDWQWVNHAFHVEGMANPFGHTARRIGDLYAGAVGKGFSTGKWKRLRRTKHTHNPVDDARGNAEALVQIDHDYELGLF